MPLNTVYVGRPTRWGNPASIVDVTDEARSDNRRWRVTSDAGEYMSDYLDSKEEARQVATDWYREAIAGPVLRYDPDWFSPLRGKDLACWCPLEQPCHADVLLELANTDPSR